MSGDEDLFDRLLREANHAKKTEPLIGLLLSKTVLHPDVKSFEDAVVFAVSHRLAALACKSNSPDVCPKILREIMLETMSNSELLEMGHTMAEACREDCLSYVQRDPACETLLEVLLFFKGFAALVCHRVAYRKWKKPIISSAANDDDKEEEKTQKMEGQTKNNLGRYISLWFQSQASSSFGVDIHPGAQIGQGVMMDHATGIVIGETAKLGDGSTLLHGVTLGGTGKESGDRHPKVGKDVLIGANASILGNIYVGDSVKIGCGSVVLKPIPHGATAVGSPARIIGRCKETNPGSFMDSNLTNVKGAFESSSALSSLSSDITDTTTTASITSAATNTEENDEERNRDIQRQDSSEGTIDSIEEVDEEEEEENGSIAKVIDEVKKEGKNGKISLLRHKLCSLTPSFMCPFSEISQSMPPNRDNEKISIPSLSSSLFDKGCTDAEISEVVFAIMRKCCKRSISHQRASMLCPKIIGKYTKLDKGEIREVVEQIEFEKS